MGIKCTLAGMGAQALRMFPRPGTACPPRCSPAERAQGLVVLACPGCLAWWREGRGEEKKARERGVERRMGGRKGRRKAGDGKVSAFM